jgi:hypothetical protein
MTITIGTLLALSFLISVLGLFMFIWAQTNGFMQAGPGAVQPSGHSPFDRRPGPELVGQRFGGPERDDDHPGPGSRPQPSYDCGRSLRHA